MKKIILTLLVFPMFLVSCAEKGDDPNIQGTWQGQVKVSDLETLGLNKEALAANDRLATETLVFRFDDRKIEIYRSKDASVMDSKIEAEIGEYNAEDNSLDITITALSCATPDGKNFDKVLQLKRRATYSINDDFKGMTLNFGINKKIQLDKLEGQDELDMDNSIEGSDVGCFVNGNPGSFKKNKVQKPTKQIDLQAKLEEVKNQAQAEEENQQPTAE